MDEDAKGNVVEAAIRSISDVVRWVYAGWIMRDFLGRVVPGAVVLWAGYYDAREHGRPLDFDAALPYLTRVRDAWSTLTPFMAMFVGCLAWFLGMTLERLALFTKIAHPMGHVAMNPFKLPDYMKLIRFGHSSSVDHRLQYERFIVTTNAQANMGFALFLCSALGRQPYLIVPACLLCLNAISVGPHRYRDSVVEAERMRTAPVEKVSEEFKLEATRQQAYAWSSMAVVLGLGADLAITIHGVWAWWIGGGIALLLFFVSFYASEASLRGVETVPLVMKRSATTGDGPEGSCPVASDDRSG